MKKINSNYQVTAFILSFNCGHMLEKAYQKIPKDLVSRIILCDDCSQDNTTEIVKSIPSAFYRNSVNLGYGGNILASLGRAFGEGADYAVEIHGDGAQFNPEALRDAVKYMDQGYDLILGSRFIVPGLARKNGMPLIRFLANKALSFFDRAVLELPLTEFHTGFRIYSKNLYQKIALQHNSNDYLFSFEIIAQACYYDLKICEVPVEADYHSEHTSHALLGATIYALQTFVTLLNFKMAKLKIRYSKKFPKLD